MVGPEAWNDIISRLSMVDYHCHIDLALGKQQFRKARRKRTDHIPPGHHILHPVEGLPNHSRHVGLGSHRTLKNPLEISIQNLRVRRNTCASGTVAATLATATVSLLCSAPVSRCKTLLARVARL